MVFGVLERFDLPDCLRELSQSKQLTVIHPWNSQMQTWKPADLRPHLRQLDLQALQVQWIG